MTSLHTMHLSEPRKDILFLVLVCGVSVCVHLPGILAFPDFLADDFLVFSKIKFSPFPCIGDAQALPFALAFRPLVTLSLWLELQLWGTQAVLYKLTNLAVHLVLVVQFYYLLRLVLSAFTGSTNRILQGLLALLLSVHSDVFYWMVWISNRTELLMVLFYVNTLLFTLKYLVSGKSRWYAGAVMMFLLSVLCKEQPLHFPVLFIIVSLLYDRIRGQRFNPVPVLVRSIPFFIIAVTYVLLRQAWLPVDMPADVLWKKPFSSVGTLVYCIVPVAEDVMYKAFYQYANVAAFLFAAIILVGGYFTVVAGKARQALLVLLIMGLSLVPRMFANGGPRINSIQIVILILLSAVFLQRYAGKVMMHALLVAFIVLHICSTLYLSDRMGREGKLHEASMISVVEHAGQHSSQQLYVLVCSDIDRLLLPYELYFRMHDDFGYSPRVHASGITFSTRFEYTRNPVTVRRSNDNWTMTAANNTVSIDTIGLHGSNGMLAVLSAVPYPSGKQFSQITMLMKLPDPDTAVIYSDGTTWRISK